MIEGPRIEVEVRAQIPEVFEGDVAGELEIQILPVAPEVELRARAEGRIEVLDLAARFRLPVAQAPEPEAPVRVAEPARVIGIVRRRLPSQLHVVEPVPLGLAEPEGPDGARQLRALRVVMGIPGVGALKEMHAGALDAVDRRRVAADVTEPEPAAQKVRAPVPAQYPIRTARVRVLGVARGQERIHVRS